MLNTVCLSLELANGTKTVLTTEDLAVTETKHGVSISGSSEDGAAPRQVDLNSVSLYNTTWDSTSYNVIRLYQKSNEFEIVGVR